MRHIGLDHFYQIDIVGPRTTVNQTICQIERVFQLVWKPCRRSYTNSPAFHQVHRLHSAATISAQCWVQSSVTPMRVSLTEQINSDHIHRQDQLVQEAPNKAARERVHLDQHF